MDGYPAGSLDHNVPLLVVSGLNEAKADLPLDSELKEQGILLRSELPTLETKESKVLDEYLKEVDDKGTSWVGVERDEPYRFRVKTIGRSFLLPPRHARLPETDEPPSAAPTLHSPFSPLSPCSSIYPDGLLDAQWISKHQDLVPSILLCFYTITTDPTTMTLQDNRLKNDIGGLKTALAKSGYRTRLAVALLSDDDSTPATLSAGLQERLENIRRGSGLDPKSFFYIPPQTSPTELTGVADNILAALYVSAVEYYRDLGRHARKKRSRGWAPPPTIPPTSGTSRTLSLPDWNFRYDFKSAVLGEFRQEYEAAMKSYEQAYEVLLGQDVLDVIPSWSPRWNEARLLADVIAIRLLRLHFWLGQTTLAVRRWQGHRIRIADFVDRRGCGTDNYGWEAWEARWALVMVDLMDKVELKGLEPSTNVLHLPPEKAVLGDRLQPWELLHHKGYWYRIAARHLAKRRTLAHQIPDDERTTPDATKSKPATKSYNYDSYLCPEPHEEYPIEGDGVNHARLIADSLSSARAQFHSRKQLRTAAELSLDCAKEMANMKSWGEVISILKPLWEDVSFRTGWMDISEDLCWLLRRAAVEDGRGELVVAIDWELMNKRLTRRPKWPYDLSKSLDGMALSSKPSVKITDDEVLSFVEAAFVFRTKESRAGDSCTAQLILKSDAFPDAVPVTLSDIRIEFEGGLKHIAIEHSSSSVTEGRIGLSTMTLKEQYGDGSEDELPLMLQGQSDLTLKPGQTRVLEMSIPLREAGDVSASFVTLCHRPGSFDMEYKMKLGLLDQVNGWFTEGSIKPARRRFGAHNIHVQPRPPKMDIKLVDPMEQYYANEPVELQVQLHNAEDEAATIKLDTHLFGKPVPSMTLILKDQQQKTEDLEEETKITGFSVGRLASSSTLDLTLRIDPADAPTTFDLHLRATYHLESDSATPIMQLLPVHINVVNAFEANYDLVPRLHLAAWPSLFDYDNVHSADGEDKTAKAASGLSQNWCLICHYASFATEDLEVVGMEVRVLSASGHARCNVAKQAEVPGEGIVVSPKTMHEARFDLTAQKMTLDDRQPVSLDLAVMIKWKRKGDKSKNLVNTTTMLAGQYLVLSTEPRALATVFETPENTDQAEGLVHLEITIENPSSHFLTFGLTMEPSDEFAFSGAKQTTLHLLPMSRRTATYRLLPLVRGEFVRPGLVVRDKYFQKVLRIIPTEGMKIDKDGLLVWVPAAEGEEAPIAGAKEDLE